MAYSEFIKRTPLVRDEDVVVVQTTGDADYPGTSLEVSCGETELFHIVVDDNGVQQVIVFPQREHYRMDLSTLDAIILAAKGRVHAAGEG